MEGGNANLGDFGEDSGVEETVWWWVFPVFELGSEFLLADVPKDGGHDHTTPAPWWAEIEVKLIVLIVRSSLDIALLIVSTLRAIKVWRDKEWRNKKWWDLPSGLNPH